MFPFLGVFPLPDLVFYRCLAKRIYCGTRRLFIWFLNRNPPHNYSFVFANCQPCQQFHQSFSICTILTMRKRNTIFGNGILMQNWLSPSLLEIKVGVFLFQSKELRDIINVKLSPVTLVIGLKVSAKVSQLQVILPAPYQNRGRLCIPVLRKQRLMSDTKLKVVWWTLQWRITWYIFR